MIDCILESRLHEAWRRSDVDRAPITTWDGREYRILYSGMPAGSYGPDFRDAVLEAEDGSEVQGDIEIHTVASEWYGHGHDRDKNYDRVIFHAVCIPSDARNQTLNSLGLKVPEIGIAPLISEMEGCSDANQRRGERLIDDSESVHKWLDAAGDKRFVQKAASKRIDVERFGPELAMQLAVFECLGYPRNRVQFRLLAQRLPWAFLARFAYHRDGNSEDGAGTVKCAVDLLRWASGLAPRPDWVPVPRLAGDAPEWNLVGSRPSNRPASRVVAAAHLVARWWQSCGPLRYALQGISSVRRASQMRDAYRVDDGVLGTGRAGEIVVNAVLPTVAAWAEVGGDYGLYREAMRLYREHPSLPSNSVLSEAGRTINHRVATVGRVRGARQQQGAMHLYNTMLLRPRAASQMRLGRWALSS